MHWHTAVLLHIARQKVHAYALLSANYILFGRLASLPGSVNARY